MTGNLLKGFFWFCGSLLISLCSSCSDFDSFGTDLLNNGWINAKGIDTFKLFAKSASLDSSITFNGYSNLSSTNLSGTVSFPIGKMDDPVFGKVSATVGTQLRNSAVQNAYFLHSPIDSIILSLRFDTSLFYGKYMQPMNFSVYPLTEALGVSTIYYSNHVLQFDATKKLGERLGYVPNKMDSVSFQLDTIVNHKVYPQLRIPIDTGAFMTILRTYSDTVYTLLDSFSKVFNGIAIRCEQGNGTISVQPEHSDSKLTIYYHNPTLTFQSMQDFNMSSLAVKIPCYQVDNTNTLAEQCINGAIPGDSLICLQGLTGRNIHLQIPYDSGWNGKFINFAVLQFYVAEPVIPFYDLSNYSLPGLLEIFDISSGSRVAIDDVVTGLQTNYTRVFGGNPIVKTDLNGKSLYLYKMNITRHFQKSLRAKQPLDLIISPLFKLESPARAVFFGPGSAQYPAKLILTYSE